MYYPPYRGSVAEYKESIDHVINLTMAKQKYFQVFKRFYGFP